MNEIKCAWELVADWFGFLDLFVYLSISDT